MRSVVFLEFVGLVMIESLLIGKLILRFDKVKKVFLMIVLLLVRILLLSGLGLKEGCFFLLGLMVFDDEDCWLVFYLKDVFLKLILVVLLF